MTTSVDTEVQDMEATKALTADDRCDRCGAQAYVRAIFSGSPLLFCAHHAKEHGEKIRHHVTVDDTAKLA